MKSHDFARMLLSWPDLELAVEDNHPAHGGEFPVVGIERREYDWHAPRYFPDKEVLVQRGEAHSCNPKTDRPGVSALIIKVDGNLEDRY